MSFLKLILKNPFRNRSRAILSILGIGIGIITIVALGAITNGLVESAESTLHVGGTDFIVMSPDGTESIDSEWNSKIKNISGVASATSVYNAALPIEGSGYLSLQGRDPSTVNELKLKIINGTNFKNNSNEIIIGKIAMERFNKTVNDTITTNGEKWKIVGVFESGDPNVDTESFGSLTNVQKFMDDEDKISGLYVKVAKGADVEKITKNIENKYDKNISAVSSISDMESSKDILDMLNGAKWGISLLAILVGGIGIINTMIMSVYERTREIGVLKSVGWSGRRIIGMIVGESIVITLIAGIIGSLVGVIIVELIAASGMLDGMTPILSINIFLEAILISLIVGIVGGLYPAIRASKLPPTEALRYE
ncbi:ABC transporter permease [Methanobrevibacter sp. TMH8]|uniref:ABC transporter permease n=1 Tax=Methanobrevibacter sp. TMH8 TaxID=2848611 RepID=UPI001CCF4025|nr:ABC transporter permease [Methanobrevibacter sp. TMH8]MBZ9571079.1 ABC transporter permease [Methanobrevibacter sp. TMH8]